MGGNFVKGDDMDTVGVDKCSVNIKQQASLKAIGHRLNFRWVGFLMNDKASRAAKIM